MSRLKDLLNRNAQKTRDLIVARAVEPVGAGGLYVIEIIGTGQRVTAQAPPGVTWEPGAQVLASQDLGYAAHHVLSAPPSGQGGETVYPTIKYPPAPAPVLTKRYLALCWTPDGETVTAVLYRDGTQHSDLATRAFSYFSLSHPEVIGTDPPSVLFVETAEGEPVGIRAWDTGADVIHEYEPAGGTLFSVPHYVGGHVYWMEYPEQVVAPAAAAINLIRALPNLSSPTLVGTYSLVATEEIGPTVTFTNGADTAASSSAMTAFLIWAAGGGGAGAPAVRLQLDGGSGAEAASSAQASGLAAEDRSVMAIWHEGFSSLAVRLDEIAATYSVIWPTVVGDPWQNASIAGSAVVIYGNAIAARGSVFLSTATSTFEVTAHPTTATVPDYFFALE